MSRCDQSNKADQSNMMLRTAVQSTMYETVHFLIWRQRSPWTTDGKKTLPNLGSIASKQDEVRVREVWSSCVQGTLSSLLPKLLKQKRWMLFGFCCIQGR